MENSDRWFEEWKNSIDPEEYEAVIKETAERFDAKIDRRIERRKQIKADRERREKEEAEREAERARARAEAKAKADAESAAAEEEEALGPPPTKEEHELVSATPSIPGTPGASCTTAQSATPKTTATAPTTPAAEHPPEQPPPPTSWASPTTSDPAGEPGRYMRCLSTKGAKVLEGCIEFDYAGSNRLLKNGFQGGVVSVAVA
ncbi:MAG: hypothetical protein J4G14_12065 [Dehalococcoidia bacterium]|nr:hypothetical protein [Dehalococcoidia bacterium]